MKRVNIAQYLRCDPLETMQRHVGFAFSAPALLNLFRISSRADGIGETEGKAVMGSGEPAGKRVSFNRKSAIGN
jgi:hypothetical protein